MKRRHFLMTAAASAALPKLALAADANAVLRAEPVTAQILPEGDGATRMLGFNGSMPGPEIRLPRGRRATVDVHNALEQDTAVHWHGIRLENAMDGVPMLTQDPIVPGAAKTYSFVPPDAGTFWYHSHHISHAQVALGLMGPLIIEEDTAVDVDHDITVMIADWPMTEDGVLIEEFENRHSLAHAGLMGTFARAYLSTEVVRQGDRVRLRLINAATNRIFPLTFGGAAGTLVALDGMPLVAPRPAADIMLAPAQRADVIMDVAGPVALQMQSRQGPYDLGELRVEGRNERREATDVAPLPPHSMPLPGTPSQTLTLTMLGGAMGGRHGGDDIWSFNDISGLGDAPFARLKRGETARITLVNDTSFPHGIHLHGHHFYELAADGALGDLRDTSLVMPGNRLDILCVFDNPGRWMLHCHMLSHAVAGMRTWVEVA